MMKKIKKFQQGAISIKPNNIWNSYNNLDEFQLQNQNLVDNDYPYLEMDNNQMTETVTPNDSPYTVNQKPLVGLKKKNSFDFNARNFSSLYALNSGLNMISNLRNNNSSVISPFGDIQYTNGRNKQDKYGYSFQKGGSKDPSYEALSLVYTNRNRNLPWVDRGLNPQNYPIYNQQDFMDKGKLMTHQLSWSENDDFTKFFVQPEINYNNSNLEWNNNQQPIEFNSKKMAEYYSKNGLIKHFQKGGTKQNPPKVYTDPIAYNKAAQSYNDSLSLYNYYTKQYSISGKKKAPTAEQLQQYQKQLRNPFKDFPDTKIIPLKNSSAKKYHYFDSKGAYNANAVDDVVHPNIKPIGAYVFDDGSVWNTNINLKYKKPVQPVVYQKPQPKTQERAPIVVTNPNDPRLKAYKDSLDLYGETQRNIKRLQIDNNSNVESYERVAPGKKYPNVIEPINRIKVNGSYFDIPNYKKPVQPVVYQPQQTINTTKGRVTGDKFAVSTNKQNVAILNSKLVPKKSIHTNVDNPITNHQQLVMDIHPITNMKRLSLPNYNLDNYKIQVKGETIPLPKMRLPQQGSIPFYGPGNTIIGYTDENRKFYPAQQYTGAQNNPINLQDKELLNNHELLKKYVLSKDTYKFQKGGYVWSNEDDDFLFGDEEDTQNVTKKKRVNDEEIVNEVVDKPKFQYDWSNDPLGLLQGLTRKNYVLKQPTETTNYINEGDWTSEFRKVEDSNSKFNHGNGAYGSFGYRKSGHLQQAYKTAPEFQELRKSYGDFNNFWNTFTKQGYNDFTRVVDSNYENWLKRQTNNDLVVAGRFNLTGSKKNTIENNGSNNMSTSGYINKLLKYRKGGINDNNGYLIDNLHNFTPKKIINSNHITTNKMAFPILANGIPLYPNTGDYIFPTDKVIEKPLYLNGGIHYVDNGVIANLKQKRIKFKYV